MHFDTRFSGRVIQVTEALSFDDAVSNQVLALDALMRRMGLRTAVHTKWHDPRLEAQRCPLDDLRVDERDIVICHFYGYAEHSMPLVAERLYCTKVMIYHNITPHDFFDERSSLHAFCKRGREQLKALLPRFHRCWADSAFNLSELIEAGLPAVHGRVVPIVVPQPPAAPTPATAAGQAGVWLFVGRVAANKGQRDLIREFAAARRSSVEWAQQLWLAGGYDTKDPYFAEIESAIAQSGCADRIRLLGKVSNDVRDTLYQQASVFVSASRHEGFGVPLIEAAAHGLPVVALSLTAVPETLAVEDGLAPDLAGLRERAVRVQQDESFRRELLDKQARNAARFTESAVSQDLRSALADLLPAPDAFRRLSVVICTLNRRDYLERVLEYLQHQSLRSIEVIVVDGPSTDGTKELVATLTGRVKVSHNPQRNLSVSRNIGIELASGDVIAFIDDDALPFDDWGQAVLDEYNARPLTTAALGGPVFYAGSLEYQAQDIAINRFADTKVNIERHEVGLDGWWRLNIGTNATFAADKLRQARGFDEQFDYFLDESELCFRLQHKGWLVGYAEGVLLRHEFARSDNRTGKFSYNWRSICKNTAYFMAAYSGLEGRELRDRIDTATERDRIQPLRAALERGELARSDFDTHVDAIRAGVDQGLEDYARHYPRTREVPCRASQFLPFETRHRTGAGDVAGGLHVCIVTKEFPPFVPGGGIGTLYYHLASELLLMGHRVSVIAPGDAAPYVRGRFRLLRQPVHQLAQHGVEGGFAYNMSWSVSALKALADLHGELPVDVVDSALWDSECLALSLLPADRRPPLVVRLVTPFAVAAEINGWQVDPAVAAQFNAAESNLIRNADAVIPISLSIARSIVDIHGLPDGANWHLVPCGIAHWPFFDVNLGYGDLSVHDRIPASAVSAGKLVLFVGRLERRKGIDLLLVAANRFLADCPQAHLLVCGRDVEGWQGRIADLIEPTLRTRIHFIGEIADSTKEKLLARATCLVFPSRYESFGLVPLEAFIHGVPVVACRAGAIPEVVPDGQAGLLFEPEDAKGLAAAVTQLVHDEALHGRMSAAAKARSRELSSRASALGSVRIYRDLVHRRRAVTESTD